MKIKRIFRIIIDCLQFVFQLRCMYSIWFNFRYLPFNYAIRLPFRFYPHAYAYVDSNSRIELSQIFLTSKSKLIYIGLDLKDFSYQCEKTYLCIKGHVIFSGKTTILRGASIDVRGTLKFGDDVLISSLTRIRAFNYISIGDHVRIAHENQLYDSNFHYVVDVDNPEYKPMSKPIIIGDYVWIGNRSTIGPGAVIPTYTIVASNSLVNKDMSNINPYTLIGGVPCKVLKEGVVRVWNYSLELQYQIKEFQKVLLQK